MLVGKDSKDDGSDSKATDPLLSQKESAEAEVKFAYKKAGDLNAYIEAQLGSKLNDAQLDALNKLQALLLYYNRLYVSSSRLTKATTYVRDWHKHQVASVEKALNFVIADNALEGVKIAPSFLTRLFTTYIDPDLSWISLSLDITIPEFAFLTGESDYALVGFLKNALYFTAVGFSLLGSTLAHVIVSVPPFVIRQIAKLVVTISQAALGLITLPYIIYKHFFPAADEYTNDAYRAIRSVYKPWDRVLALKNLETVNTNKLDEYIKAYEQLLRPSTTGEISAINQLKIDALYQLKALIGKDVDGDDSILDAISRFMEAGKVEDNAHQSIKAVVKEYSDNKQAKLTGLRKSFSEITEYYQHKLFHDVRVSLELGNNADQKLEEKGEQANAFQLVVYKSPLGVWQYRTRSVHDVVSKPQFVGLLKNGNAFIASLEANNDNLDAIKTAVKAIMREKDNKSTLRVFKSDDKWMFTLGDKEVAKAVSSLTGGSSLIPWLEKGKKGELSPAGIATLERNLRQVVLSNQESAWQYARSYARYLWSEDHYQAKTVRGSLPLVKSEWEKDNLNFIKFIDTIAHLDTDGRYVDQVAQIINVDGEFDETRKELLSKTLSNIFLDMQTKSYAQIGAADEVFFAKLDKRYVDQFTIDKDFARKRIQVDFYKMANQAQTSNGDREARRIANELAKDLFGVETTQALIRKKFIHSFLSERDRVHAQKAAIQAELKRYKVAMHHLLEQLDIARHIQSKNKADQTFFGHKVKYTYDEEGTVYIPEDKQETRGWKSTLLLLGLFVGIIVGLGEGVVAAFAMMTVMMLIVPIIFVGGALCNYFLMKGDTYAVLLDWFTKVEVVDPSGHKRLVRKLWVDRDGNEVGALAYVMSFFGLAAFGTGIVYGCLSANCILGLFGLSIGSLLTMMSSGGIGMALLAFAGVFLPAVSTAIAITSIYFIVIANFIKLGGLSKAWAALKKAFGNDELGKSFGESTWANPFGFFTWERITYTLVSIIAEVPRLVLALALSAIVILVGFILFKGNSTALLAAFGIGAGASEAAGFAFAGMNTASNVVFAFKKILAMIDLVWKKAFIQPLANLIISVLTIWCTNAFQQRLFGVVDAYVNSGHLKKEVAETQPALALLKIALGLPLKLAFGALAFFFSWMFEKTAVMLMSDVSNAVDSLVSCVWNGIKVALLQPVFKLVSVVLSALYWLCSFGQKNRFSESFKAVDNVLGINQKEKNEVVGLAELPNPVQSRSGVAISVKWSLITVGTLFNSTGQAFLMGGSIPKIPNFMNTTLGMTTMPSTMAMSMAIYPSMWLFSFGPNFIAYDGVIEGQSIGAIDGAHFTVQLGKDDAGKLMYTAILGNGKALPSRSIEELGPEASAKIALAFEDGVVTDEVRDLIVNAAAKQAEDNHNSLSEHATATTTTSALFRPKREDVVIRDGAPAAFPALRAAC